MSRGLYSFVAAKGLIRGTEAADVKHGEDNFLTPSVSGFARSRTDEEINERVSFPSSGSEILLRYREDDVERSPGVGALVLPSFSRILTLDARIPVNTLNVST